MYNEKIITGEIIGRAPGLILVQPDPIYLDRFAALPPSSDGIQRFKLDNTTTQTTHSRPSPRRSQYRDFFSLPPQNARPELAYANPGTFSELARVVAHLVDVVRATLEFTEPAGDEHLINTDLLNDLAQAYQYTIQTIQQGGYNVPYKNT